MQLNGKTAIITGGGSGFGASMADLFAKNGAKIIVADINLDSARKVAEGTGGYPFEVDVSSAKSVEQMKIEIFKKYEKVDIVVNNAGTTHLPAPMETIEEDEFDRVFNVNCKSVYLTAKHFVPHFKENKSGVILNIASTAGVSPRPNLNWYNSSKGWMILASKTMAVELAPFGIRVNVINPVAGETPLLKSFLGEDTPEMREKFLSTIPLGRFSMPEDIASAALFLCSDAASMITGANLEVDGGRTI
ncbi:glucose 1-dehydrogenase [bacterium]|nr:glucose 1-dehydrogenase [bacterium]